MEDLLRDKLEYAVRFGLQHAAGNVHKAKNIAEAKYHSMIQRQPNAAEKLEISLLLREVHEHQATQHGIPSVAGLAG